MWLLSLNWTTCMDALFTTTDNGTHTHRHGHEHTRTFIYRTQRAPKRGAQEDRDSLSNTYDNGWQNYKIQKVIRLSMVKNALVACFRWFRLGVWINLFVRNARKPTRMRRSCDSIFGCISRQNLLCMNWRVHARYIYMHCLGYGVVSMCCALRQKVAHRIRQWHENNVRAHKCPKAHNMLAEVCFSLKF